MELKDTKIFGMLGIWPILNHGKIISHTFDPTSGLSVSHNLASVSEEQIKQDFIKNNINCSLDYIYTSLNGIPNVPAA